MGIVKLVERLQVLQIFEISAIDLNVNKQLLSGFFETLTYREMIEGGPVDHNGWFCFIAMARFLDAGVLLETDSQRLSILTIFILAEACYYEF